MGQTCTGTTGGAKSPKPSSLSSPPEENKLAGRYNPMCEAFPRVASCNYYQYGAAGGQSKLNALCILALNVIIDKIYLILWAWYAVLITLGVVRMIERVLQFLFGCVRYQLMKFRMHRYFKDSQDTHHLQEYLKSCSKGDWFVLYQMSQNMNRRLFFMFLTTLAKTPKWELRQVIPQINVVNAFKSSVKNKSKGNSTPAVPTWKLNVTKKAEPETPSAPTIEIKMDESECFKKKQDDAQKEEFQRRKRHEDDEDSDEDEEGKDVKVRIRSKKDEERRKDRMFESCRNWATARGRFGNQHKWK